MHVGTGVPVGATVGAAVVGGVVGGAAVGAWVTTGPAENVGRPVVICVPPIRPLRIGNEAEALTLIASPSMLLMSGVISENRHVTATTVGDPTSVPVGKVGAGRVSGRAQLIWSDSLVISRSYSV